MSRIDERFSEAKQLVPYIMGGWPNPELCEDIFNALIDAGCGIVEIGVPYSDPLADGPTIQKAGEEALGAGTTTESVLEIISRVTKKRDVSPVLMVYYNLIYRYGMKRFAAAAREAGVEGVIVPDLTVEESGPWREIARAHGLDTIFLAAPTSSPARLAKIAACSTGFVYVVSLTGVTGARAELPADLLEFAGAVKAAGSLPTAVGFGVSAPEQARNIASVADGVIVGSALINLIGGAAPDEVVEKVGSYARLMIDALRNR